MARTLLGIVAGVFLGVIVIMVVESLGHVIFPPPDGTDLKDPEALKAIMMDVPVGAKFAVLVAWGLGVFAGGAVARKIAADFPHAAWLVGVALFAAAAFTMMQIPHPVWMMAGSVIATIAGVFAANAAVKPKA